MDIVHHTIINYGNYECKHKYTVHRCFILRHDVNDNGKLYKRCNYNLSLDI